MEWEKLAVIMTEKPTYEEQYLWSVARAPETDSPFNAALEGVFWSSTSPDWNPDNVASVPEPGTFLLIGPGLAGIALLRNKAQIEGRKHQGDPSATHSIRIPHRSSTPV